VLGLGATSGGECSRRWRRGGAGAAVSSADGRRQRSRAGEQSRRQRKKKRGGGLRDLVGICKNLKDSSVNLIFPLIQNSNEEMTKVEVVEFFKSYNFALGFKFKNLKHNALFYHFALKSNLNKFCPSQGKFLITLDLIASIYDIHKRTCIFINLHKYPYFHNFA
jgi:hypothetical protein